VKTEKNQAEKGLDLSSTLFRFDKPGPWSTHGLPGAVRAASVTIMLLMVPALWPKLPTLDAGWARRGQATR